MPSRRGACCGWRTRFSANAPTCEFEVGALGLQANKDEHANLCSGLSNHALISPPTGDLRVAGWLQRVVTV